MSSWADHCSSSDEESPALSSVLPVPETVPELSPINNVAGARKYPHNSSLSSPSSSPHRRSSNRSGGGTSPNLVLPSGPPFTAFLGGMASDVQPNELCHELEVLAGNALGTVVKCLHARIVASNRKGGQGSSVNHQHPNFAYVEMETLDDVSLL